MIVPARRRHPASNIARIRVLTDADTKKWAAAEAAARKTSRSGNQYFMGIVVASLVRESTTEAETMTPLPDITSTVA